MNSELTKKQKRIKDMLYTWIQNNTLPPEFSILRKGNEIFLLPSNLQIIWENFESDSKKLVELGYFKQILRNGGKYFLYLDKKDE